MKTILFIAPILFSMCASAQTPVPPAFGGVPIYDENGKYWGVYNDNELDLDSVSNPYGQYGSEYSPDSLNNPINQMPDATTSQPSRSQQLLQEMLNDER
jgi:hypothetical protein